MQESAQADQQQPAEGNQASAAAAAEQKNANAEEEDASSLIVKGLPPHVKQVQKKALDPLLKCPLCTGFFRDAHTINECLCSFCKACIYKYFYGYTKREQCPKCGTKLGGKPLKSVIADSSL